jgi:glutamate-1-semialdehyde 2,1-aminomutase
MENALQSYTSMTRASCQVFTRARRFLPGGTAYNLRAFEPYPFSTTRAQGSWIFDLDGNKYLDFWCGHFGLILGHAHPAVIAKLKEQLEKGYQFGTFHELELKLAEQVIKMLPSAEMVKFTTSGTEANMYAVRLARTYTHRVKIAKFEGNWHGGYDGLHIGVKPPFTQVESGGLSPRALQDTLVLPYNNLEEAERVIKTSQLAGVIIEPVLGSEGMIPAKKEFLKGLREICTQTGTLLIFDEIITGFRISPGGAQQVYNVLPDLTVLGKILGGGLPIGAIAGRREIMEHLDHFKYSGGALSFVGGTGNSNPLSLIAGYTTLQILEKGDIYDYINNLGELLRKELTKLFVRKSVAIQITGFGSLFCYHFTKEPQVTDVRAAARGRKEIVKKFHLYLLSKKIFFPKPGLIRGAISRAHTQAELDYLLNVTEDFVKENY